MTSTTMGPAPLPILPRPPGSGRPSVSSYADQPRTYFYHHVLTLYLPNLRHLDTHALATQASSDEARACHDAPTCLAFLRDKMQHAAAWMDQLEQRMATGT